MLARRIVLVAIPILLLATAVASAGRELWLHASATRWQGDGGAVALDEEDQPRHVSGEALDRAARTARLSRPTAAASRATARPRRRRPARRGSTPRRRAATRTSATCGRCSTRSRSGSHARLPGAHVQRTYQVVLNGLAVKMNRGQAARARRMIGVRAVTPDVAYHLDMFSTPQQIGAPTLWGQVGGQANAGAGVKVAIIDSGIFVRHDAAGNLHRQRVLRRHRATRRPRASRRARRASRTTR